MSLGRYFIPTNLFVLIEVNVLIDMNSRCPT